MTHEIRILICNNNCLEETNGQLVCKSNYAYLLRFIHSKKHSTYAPIGKSRVWG